jgi:hypothetical protein
MDLGGSYGEHAHAARVQVMENIHGPSAADGNLTVLQTGSNAEPYSCGGLHWSAERRVALVLNPSEHDGVFEIVLDFEQDPPATGWVEEHRWVFTTGGGLACARDGGTNCNNRRERVSLPQVGETTRWYLGQDRGTFRVDFFGTGVARRLSQGVEE